MQRFLSVDPLADKYPGINPYAYTLNNPVRLVDPTGMWPNPPKWLRKMSGNIAAFSLGVVNAIGSNGLGGAGRRNPNELGAYAQAASNGQTTGDVVSVVLGVVESAAAIVAVGGESAGAFVTGGVTAAAIPATAAVVTHGTVFAGSGLKNLLSDDGVVQANDNYENPGHHDPSGGNSNYYDQNKSTLPENHQELWESSTLGSDGNKWAKEGTNKKAVYHRFQNDGNGNWHWNGSTNGSTLSGRSREININNVPVDIKR